MHCQITAGLPEGRRAEGDAEGAAEKEKRPVTVVTISSIGYHQPTATDGCLSLLGVVFQLRSHTQLKNHSSSISRPILFFSLFLFFLPSTRFLGVLSVYILEKFACTLRLLASVLSSYLHHGISFLFSHLSWKLYGKWRYSFRGGKLGPLEEVGEIEDRGRMLNLPTTRSKSDITMENDEGRCHPLCATYIHTYVHIYTYTPTNFPQRTF